MRDLPRRVSKTVPCPVCGHDSWCLFYEDGSAAICTRVQTDRPVGSSGGYLHKFDGRPNGRPEPEIDWLPRCRGWAEGLIQSKAAWLEGHLGLPAGAARGLAWVGASADDNGSHFTFPMWDGRGRVIGVSRRYPNGRKMSLGRNGLFVPAHWRTPDASETVYVVEGASDVLAMTAAQEWAVGRPSNRTGGGQLGDLLADFGGRTVVVAERDEKADGLWPGLSGAVAVADQLRAALPGRRVLVRLMPGDAKDARDHYKLVGFERARPLADFMDLDSKHVLGA